MAWKVPMTQLAHYPRYMKAIVHRLERYAADPERDLLFINSVHILCSVRTKVYPRFSRSYLCRGHTGSAWNQ